jgi:hypothetical protein
MIRGVDAGLILRHVLALRLQSTYTCAPMASLVPQYSFRTVTWDWLVIPYTH